MLTSKVFSIRRSIEDGEQNHISDLEGAHHLYLSTQARRFAF